jgi:hypothetical protein
MFVHDASRKSEPSGELGNRSCVGRRSVTTAGRPSVNVLPRAALDLTSLSEEPH